MGVQKKKESMQENMRGNMLERTRHGRSMRRFIVNVICVAMLLSLIPFDSKSVQAATVPADVSKPSTGCVFVAMEGEYVSGASAAVKRINQIRYEACKQGVKINGKKLTLKDYVPIKWSAGLEKIARIRAAESSITMYHKRLNGKSVFSFRYPGNGWVTSEVIAWNWSDGMTEAVEQWYSEKADYVAGTQGAVTGHYTSMIDPGNRYVGIGAFIGKTAYYHNTTVAQFMGAGSQSEKMAKATGKCSATVEVKTSEVTSVKITGLTKVHRSQKSTLTLRAVLGDYGKDSYKVLSGAKWTSSNPSVATVSSNGTVTGKKKGTTRITAKVGSKKTTFTVTVTDQNNHTYTGKLIKKATTKADGKILYTCKTCGGKKYVTVKKVTSVKLSATSYKYNGKTKTPSVTVKDSSGKVVPSKYYNVSYQAGRKDPGTYKVTVKLSGRYSGTVTRTYKITK